MIAAVQKYQRGFKVGRYKCDVVATVVGGQPLSVDMTWWPEHPRNFGPGWLAEYQRKRDAVMKALGDEAGIAISVVDVSG